MDKYLIKGGNKLAGEINIDSAKNCVLALMAATILTEEKVIIHKCPLITDVFSMVRILKSLGCAVEWQEDTLIVDSSGANNFEIPAEEAKEIRSSIFMMGSIVSRFKHARAVFPGGCEIGIRPIDLHLKGLRALNILIDEVGGYIYCNGENAKGDSVYLDFPSVGATENIILAAVLTEGTTIIHNAAREPEIVSLQELLNKMGAKVYGAGSSIIEIVGVKRLHGCEFMPIPDRIVAGTFIIASAITGGELVLNNCNLSHLSALVGKVNGVACDIRQVGNKVIVKGRSHLLSVNSIETSPHPGFPTDLQAQMMALQTVSDGVSLVVENMFETRFKHVSELTKMGANITVRDRTALIRGVKRLRGAEVYANDLRGGAALVLAALSAEQTTILHNIRYIERGYSSLDKQLRSVGANIDKIN